MRGDIDTRQSYDTMGARTQSEINDKQDCCGMNSLKLARILNFVGGGALCVVCVIRLLDIFNTLFNKPFVGIGEFGLNCFLL